MSWNLVELLPCRATTINHFPSYFVMSFLSSWKVAFLAYIWNFLHMATSFLSMLLSGVFIYRMNVGCTCTYKSCSSSPTWTHPNIIQEKRNYFCIICQWVSCSLKIGQAHFEVLLESQSQNVIMIRPFEGMLHHVWHHTRSREHLQAWSNPLLAPT